MSSTEDSNRIPADQVAATGKRQAGSSAAAEIVTNSDSSRTGPKGTKILTLLVFSIILIIVGFGFVFLAGR
jgi:hypothetical protein